MRPVPVKKLSKKTSVFMKEWTGHTCNNIVAKPVSAAFISFVSKLKREVCHVAIFCGLCRHILSE